MNAADLARLERAKRAYKAAQPNETEIQTGVRRARLSLGRPKPRRAWFTKGLVFVALAIGSLAYAKPHALGELVENVLPRADVGDAKRGMGTAASSLPPETPTKSGGPRTPSSPALTVPTATRVADATSEATPALALAGEATLALAAANDATPAKKATKRVRSSAPTVAAPAELAAAEAAAVSDWGRVGQALAKGDETQALAALAELSESDDQRTRDKADIGRAQLLLAHGDRDKACALARSLTNRRAGGRIERQAQALLKSCSR